MRKIILTIIIFLIFTISIILIYSKEEKEIMNNNEEAKNNFISMMVENEKGEYEEKTDITFPKENYLFNPEASGCENGGTLVWNKEKQKVEASLLTSDKCYAYFDKYDFTKSCLYGYEDNLACELIKNKDSTLIYHDGKCDYDGEENCNLEAGDNNYRYAGTDEEVNNYVCFGSDVTACPEDNLYRIIGIFNDNIKLIKADVANSDLLGQDGSFHQNMTTIVNTYKGNKQSIDIYCWQTNADGVCGSFVTGTVRDWKTSKLNTINLNTNFYGKFSEKWQKIIKENNFAIGGCNDACKAEGNAQKAFINEITENTINSPFRIGLMYISDYMYAAKANNWALPAASWNGNSMCEGTDCQDYQQAVGENWLYLGVSEWTISPINTNNNHVSSYRIYPEGFVWDNTAYLLRSIVRPVFYLEKNIRALSGDGTESNPYYLTLND